MLNALSPTRSVEHDVSNDTYVITVVPSPLFGYSNVKNKVVLTSQQYVRYTEWINDDLVMIQDALYDLSADDREILLTGLGSEEFDEIVGPEE